MRKYRGSGSLGFSLTEALIGLVIFILSIGMAALGLQIIAKHNAARQMRTKALSAIQDAYNDLQVRSGTNNDFFYDSKFSGPRYYVDRSTTTLNAFNSRWMGGGVGVQADVSNYNAVTQARPVTFTARWRLGRDQYSLAKDYSLTASRLAQYGGQINGRVVLATDTTKGVYGVGVMVEAEVGDRWIYSFTDRSGNYFLRGVKIHGRSFGQDRLLRVFGYATIPHYYFRNTGDVWQSQITKEFKTGDYWTDDEVNLDAVKTFPTQSMVPFGGMKGDVKDGVTGAVVPSAIIQVVPLRMEVKGWYDTVGQNGWEILTDANGKFSKSNLCPGNYLIYMHGSGGENSTWNKQGDLGNHYTQRPDLRGSMLWQGGAVIPKLGIETVPSPIPTYYAGVFQYRDIYRKGNFANNTDDTGAAQNVIRIDSGVNYDSDDAIHGGAHSHCPTCPSIAAHKNNWYDPLNTHFKTTAMMNLKGRIVGVTYDTTQKSFTANVGGISNVPLKLNQFPEYQFTGNKIAGKYVINDNWWGVYYSNALNYMTGPYYWNDIGIGGFVRLGYRHQREINTDSGGNFTFHNAGPKLVMGPSYWWDGTFFNYTDQQGLYQKLMLNIDLNIMSSWGQSFPTVNTTLPSSVAPVFVYPFEGNSDYPGTNLERFVLIANPYPEYVWNDQNVLPQVNIFPSSDVYHSPAYWYGFWGDETAAWQYRDRPTYFYLGRDVNDSSQRYYDLGDVRMLKRSALVQVTGTLKNALDGSNIDPGLMTGLCGSGTAYTFAYTPEGYGDHIDFNVGAGLEDKGGYLGYDFHNTVLPSLPRWDDPTYNTIPNGSSYTATNFEDGKWGYGNNRMITYKCSKVELSSATVEMTCAFLKRIHDDPTATAQTWYDLDYKHWTGAEITGGGMDRIIINFVEPNPGNAILRGQFDTQTTVFDDVEDSTSTPAVTFVFALPNAPALKSWQVSSPPKKILSGATAVIDIALDTSTYSRSRPDLLGNVEDCYYLDSSIWYTPYASVDGGVYDYPSRFWHSNFMKLKFDENATDALGPRYKSENLIQWYDIGVNLTYPKVFHKIVFAKIAGTIKDGDGNPVQGDHVVQVRQRIGCPSDGLAPKSPCSYFVYECQWDFPTDAAGHFEITDPSFLWSRGYPYNPNIQLIFNPPVNCGNCKAITDLPYNWGKFYYGYDGIEITDVEFHFDPKEYNPTKDDGEPGAT